MFAKIFCASGFGAAVFGIIALVVAPRFIAVAVVAGFAAGYLGYEYRKTLAAIPEAFAMLIGIVSEIFLFLGGIVGSISLGLWRWICKPHPFLVYTLPLGMLLGALGVERVRDLEYHQFATSDWILAAIFSALITGLTMMVIGALLVIGVESRQGSRTELLSFVSVPTDIGRGIFATVRFFCWRLWAALAVGAWRLVLKVHQYERLLCGFHSIVGGYIGYRLLVAPAMTIIEMALLVGCCALVGGVTGSLHCKLGRYYDAQYRGWAAYTKKEAQILGR